MRWQTAICQLLPIKLDYFLRLQMNILFVHQFFPSQFKFLAPALAQEGHNVLALTMRNEGVDTWQGVKIISYGINRASSQDIHPWVIDYESKVIRGENAFQKARELQKSGFEADVIIAHPGWGESLFLKEVWPKARLGIYCEYYYRTRNSDADFDSEFLDTDLQENALQDNCRVILKNSIQSLNFQNADSAISPTNFQKETYPKSFQEKIIVCHDGIDTNEICPDQAASILLNDEVVLTSESKVVTFVNRNLEPYRGYHVFMRAIPEILAQDPDTTILIIGGTKKGYGALPSDGSNWRDFFYTGVRTANPNLDWSRVLFLGTIEYQLFKTILQITSVHVYLTYPFVLSWSLLEAMSSGAAVVGSETDPVSEIIESEVNGVLVPFFDHEQLSKRILDLLSDPIKRKTLGEAARSSIQLNYDLKSVCLPAQLEWVRNLAKL